MTKFNPTTSDLYKITQVIMNKPEHHRPVTNKPNMFDIILSRPLQFIDQVPTSFTEINNTLTEHKLYYNPKYNQVTFVMPTKPNTIWLDENGNQF